MEYSEKTTHPDESTISSLFILHSGELLLWDLSKEGKDQHQTFGMGHSRIVFSITCDSAGTRVMTVSMDRQVQGK